MYGLGVESLVGVAAVDVDETVVTVATDIIVAGIAAIGDDGVICLRVQVIARRRRMLECARGEASHRHVEILAAGSDLSKRIKRDSRSSTSGFQKPNLGL